jgi:GNAT superfamily N-acetyltransferase
VRVEHVAWDDADVARLTADQQRELRARYPGSPEPGSPPTAADVSVVVLARDDDGTAVGCGALRALDGTGAEVKRMYVVPSARGRGIARAVLAALEVAALERGWTTLWLETGPRQPEAVALYVGAGYRPTGPFGAYRDDPAAADSRFFARELPPLGRPTGRLVW